MIIIIAEEGKKIHLGRVGENEARAVRFDIGKIQAEFPGATFSVLNMRPEDPDAYPVNGQYIRIDGNYLYWTLQSGDLTQDALGECELKATLNGVIVKSVIWTTEICPALDGDGEPPDPWQSWQQQVENDADRAEDAAEDSEAWAVGERGGEPVAEGDETYHNNAKYWADQAEETLASKADKVSGATNNHFAALDATGNLKDSGHADGDYARKTDTVLTTTLSRGRDATSQVGMGSLAFGDRVKATAPYSRANGSLSEASGMNAAAEGYDAKAAGQNAHAEGFHTRANNKDQHVFGAFNAPDPSTAPAGSQGRFIEIVGNGSSESNRSNARTLDWNGNEYLKGDLYVQCDKNSQNGSKVAKVSDIPEPVDISGKADKVEGAVAGNFAGLDENGNLTDSGSKASDFLTEHQDISGKADKVTGATNGNLAGLDGSGNLTDSGKKAADFVPVTSFRADAMPMSETDPTTVAQTTTELKSAIQYNVDDITRKMTYVRGDNLCRGDSTMTSGYMATNGTIYSNSDLVYSEKIPVIEGDVIRGYNTQNGSFAQRALRFVTAFDSSGSAVSASGLDNGWFYTVPSGITHIVVTIAVGTNYMISTGAVKTQYAPFSGYWMATGDFLGNLLDGFVEKNGIAQVTSGNIDGMLQTNRRAMSRNIFSKATLLGTGKYIDIGALSGKLLLRDNADLDSYIIPVFGNPCTFSNARFALLLDDDMETPIGTVKSNVTSIDTTGASFIAFTFNNSTYSASTFDVKQGLLVYDIPTNWNIEDNEKQNIAKASGAIASGGSISIAGRSAIKDGVLIGFKAKISSFSSIRLNFTTGSSITNYIDVDDTNITIKNAATAMSPIAHGLTIQNDIALFVQFINETVRISLYSCGGVYTNTVSWKQGGGTCTQPQIVSTGTVATESILEIVYQSAKRGIWFFGDSYVSMVNDERWPYYLVQDGYDKTVLLNGSAGMTSGGAMISFNTLINYGTPKIAVFASGMNDGNGATDNYKNNRSAFLALCESNGIIPVFCTVPTVPTVDNEAKNDWVKASGYRYIDFAKAVGANSSGVWYTGLLSGDGVHPSALGAKALYSQLLIDLPEIADIA